MSLLNGKIILAPLTKGGNLPFRRLCCALGADATVSEMAYARFVAKGERREQALLRKHADEKCFGVQFAVIDPEEAKKAGEIAIKNGAQFIDINCGCPIEDTTRRGLGASVLRKPAKLEHLVRTLKDQIGVPITVKIRLGWSEREKNGLAIVQMLEDAGAAAVTVHGRTREQRYSRSADWNAIAEIKSKVKIPVIGNGDILTYYEANDRLELSNVDALLIGRGALIKPWIFSEIKEQRTFHMSSDDRLEIYYQLACYMKEHFGSDEKGLYRIAKFLPWHFQFFSRYRYLPKESYLSASREAPLIQSRISEDPKDPLDAIFCSSNLKVHDQIAAILVSAEREQLKEKLLTINTPVEADNVIDDDRQEEEVFAG